MGPSLGIIRAANRAAHEVAAHSRAALDRRLGHPGELWVAIVSDDALLAGAFQRPVDWSASAAGGNRNPAPGGLFRRGSGGPAVRVGRGTVHVVLSLANPGALTAGDEKRIVNRSVRPLLRALAKVGAPAHFFGRDWVSVNHRPAAWVGFGHDATTRRTMFEAFVAMRTPFDSAPRASFLGKTPGSVDEIVGTSIDPNRLVDEIVLSYKSAWQAEAIEIGLSEGPLLGETTAVAEDPAWQAVAQESIGIVGAGVDARGVFRVGGDLLVSRDALARLEAAVAFAATEDVSRIVDATLAAPGVALDGVRSLASVRDVIVRARGSAV